MTQNDFTTLDLNTQAQTIWEKGEFIGTRNYYGYKVNLYAMPGFYAEVYYSEYLNEIDRIEVQVRLKVLMRYASDVILNL